MLALEDALPVEALARRFHVEPEALRQAFARARSSSSPGSHPGASHPEASTTTVLAPEGHRMPASIEAFADLLGEVPDEEIAAMADTDVRVVTTVRHACEQARTDPPPPPRGRSRIAPYAWLLGRIPDVEIARSENLTPGAVAAFRRRRGIPRCLEPGVPAEPRAVSSPPPPERPPPPDPSAVAPTVADPIDEPAESPPREPPPTVADPTDEPPPPAPAPTVAEPAEETMTGGSDPAPTVAEPAERSASHPPEPAPEPLPAKAAPPPQVATDPDPASPPEGSPSGESRRGPIPASPEDVRQWWSTVGPPRQGYRVRAERGSVLVVAQDLLEAASLVEQADLGEVERIDLVGVAL